MWGYQKKYIFVWIVTIVFILGTASILWASGSEVTTERAFHDIGHFLGQESTNRQEIISVLGEPHRRVKKLAGWEYWYYNSVEFKGFQLTDKNFDFLSFKNQNYITPHAYRKMKPANLRILFFPASFLLWLPLSFLTTLTAFLGSIFGIIKSSGNVRYLFIWLALGFLLALFGVIF